MFKHEICNCFKRNQVYFKRLLSNSGTNSEILSDLFGLSTFKAKSFIEKNKLENRDAQLIVHSIKFCRKLGYTNDDILKTPALLRKNPLELEQHYLTLEEGGFEIISPKILARAINYMRRVIKTLKNKKVISMSTDVPKCFLKYIENKNIASQIPLDYFSNDDKWNEVHKSILESFLKLRLNATDDDIIRLFRIHRMIKNKSFRVIQENIALAEELGFDENKILKYGYLLHNYINYPKTVLRDLPNLAGADMRKAMRVYPKLVMTSPTNMIKIYGILKEFDIEDEIIRKQMNVFHLSPETVKLRLQEIEQSPDLRVLLKHPKLLSLIIHHNRAKSRLTFLQQLKLRCTSLVILGSQNDEVFDDYIREGKDVNRSSDVIIFLQNLFNKKVEDIRDTLKRHPYYLQVPLKDMQDTYDFLIHRNYLPDNIFKAMHILLYPHEKIIMALEEIKHNDEIHFETLKQEKQLNLLLYFLEKKHHFTGNGIWNDSNNIETELAGRSLE